MISQDTKAMMAAKLVTGEEPMDALRKNLAKYIESPGVSLQDIADEADIRLTTLNSLLYGNGKDCNMRTLFTLAKGLEVGADELAGCSTFPPRLAAMIQTWRRLPEYCQSTVEWFVNLQYSMCNKRPKGNHVISVMHPLLDKDRNLKIPGQVSTMDITDKVRKAVCRKIVCGIELGVDFYMPMYSPYDVLMIANDRPATQEETAVILLDDNLFLARRMQEYRGACYYSIRDGKYRVEEADCDVVIGYVADAVHDMEEYIADGRF